MAQSARARRVGVPAAALLAGLFLGLGSGCGGSPPMDMYFGTDVGADFRAPVTDAGGDTNVTPDAATGAAGSGGQSGSAGGSGAAGAAGAAGQSGGDGAAGAG